MNHSVKSYYTVLYYHLWPAWCLVAVALELWSERATDLDVPHDGLYHLRGSALPPDVCCVQLQHNRQDKSNLRFWFTVTQAQCVHSYGHFIRNTRAVHPVIMRVYVMRNECIIEPPSWEITHRSDRMDPITSSSWTLDKSQVGWWSLAFENFSFSLK